jgi:hypothetical protein|tara:strand:- start:13319 stop:13429 length:111 start_codon:yes stop_codon:yes gene_type:complete
VIEMATKKKATKKKAPAKVVGAGGNGKTKKKPNPYV